MTSQKQVINDLESSISRLIGFLYNQQIIASDISIDPDKSQNKKLPDNCFAINSFKTKTIRALDKEHKFFVYFCEKNQKTCIFLSKTDNFSDAIGPFFEGDFFRIDTKDNLNNKAKKQKTAKLSLNKSALSLIKALPKKIKNIPKNKRKLPILLSSAKILSREFIYKLSRNKKNKNLQDTEGITFKITKLKKHILKIQSYDKGGIYDFHLNTEGKEYPPQNPADYYADAYSAICFGKWYEKTKNKKFLKAGLLCLDFIYKTYNNYIPSSIIWYHKDFKNPAFIEAVEQVFYKHLSPKKLKSYRNLISRMDSDYYSATNISALRYHWINCRNFYFNKKQKTSKFLKRLRSDQLKDGLIQDNNYGMLYFDSYDLTYHQYTLACLARGMIYRNKKDSAEKIFLKACEFSLKTLTPDGEISYYGRGANNIYHIASAIYSFLAASFIIKNRKLAGQFIRASKKMINYLLKHQQSNGMFPTALNQEIKQRYGWQHCETPYNAQSCYFLLHALNLLKKNNIAEQKIPMEKPGFYQLYPSGYAVISTKNYYSVFYKGSSASYGWSDNKHQVGVSGICMLGMPDKGSFFPVQDRPLNQKYNLPLTTSYYTNPSDVFSGNLSIFRDQIPIILHSNPLLKQGHLFFDDLILIILQGNAKKSLPVFSFPARADKNWKTKNKNSKIICSSGNYGFSAELIFSKLDFNKSLEQYPVSNPRGKAKLIRYGKLSESGDQLAAYIITPFNKNPKSKNISASFKDDLLKISIENSTVYCPKNGKPYLA